MLLRDRSRFADARERINECPLGAAALAGLILTVIGNWPRRIVLALIAAFLAANLEHIKFNYSHIDLSMLGVAINPTFLRGSLSPDFLKYFTQMPLSSQE